MWSEEFTQESCCFHWKGANLEVTTLFQLSWRGVPVVAVLVKAWKWRYNEMLLSPPTWQHSHNKREKEEIKPSIYTVLPPLSLSVDMLQTLNNYAQMDTWCYWGSRGLYINFCKDTIIPTKTVLCFHKCASSPQQPHILASLMWQLLPPTPSYLFPQPCLSQRQGLR